MDAGETPMEVMPVAIGFYCTSLDYIGRSRAPIWAE
jgi:hypothetical protein